VEIISNSIKPMPKVNFCAQTEEVEAPPSSDVNREEPKDKVEISKKKPEIPPPEISFPRLLFSVISDEQVKKVNESGHLPNNAKFVMSPKGGYVIRPNFFGLTTGTRKMPEGFEVKKNILGFSVVLPKDSEGLLIR